MTRRGNLPQDADLEPHVDAAFAHAGKDVSMRLDFREIGAWFAARIADLCEDRGLDLCDSPMAFLLCFDLVSTTMLETSSVGSRPGTSHTDSHNNVVELHSEEVGAV